MVPFPIMIIINKYDPFMWPT